MLYSQENWDADYSGLEFFCQAADDDPVTQWLLAHIPPAGGSCIELGCFPGKYLALLGKLGYELNGVDLTPRVDTDLPTWLRGIGLRVGEFKRADIWEYKQSKQFDLVCSFGLIEHFVEWQQLLRRHMTLVRPGGKLVISVPNFSGFLQRIVHELADKPNLLKHNLEAMNLIEWRKLLPENEWEIEFCGWFGGCLFWMGDSKRNDFQKIAYRLARNLAKVLRKILPDHKASSVCCGLIARRVGENYSNA